MRHLFQAAKKEVGDLMKSKWLWLILGGFILVFFILGTSYAWYLLFSDTEVMVANLAISFEDSNRQVNLQDSSPLSDELGKQVVPYVFSITNTGTVTGTYRLIFKEQTPDMVNDGCTSYNQLRKDQMKYQLVLNQIPIAFGNLGELERDILDLRKIMPKEKNYYQLRVWVDQDQPGSEVVNRHFHYTIEVQSVEGES